MIPYICLENVPFIAAFSSPQRDVVHEKKDMFKIILGSQFSHFFPSFGKAV